METLKAATAQDIFDHLSRIADDRYKPGRNKWEATRSMWTDGLMMCWRAFTPATAQAAHDEKLIRSAYYFYIRQQIPRKAHGENMEPEAELLIEAEV